MPETESGSFDTDQIDIHLLPSFAQPHRQIIDRYMRGQEPLSSDDWLLLIQVMDMMSTKLIGEMDDAEFEQIIDAFIDRPTTPEDEIPAELVFAMLDRAEQAEGVLKLKSAVVGNRLVLSTPVGASLPANIREIEVNLPNVRVIISLEPIESSSEDYTVAFSGTTGIQ